MLWNGTTLVKGHNFNNSRRTGSPISTIKVYNSRDVDEIIFYDIEKNNSTEEFNLDFIKQLTDECSVPITIGGGIKKISHIDDLLFAGADKVSINTELYKNPELLEKAAKTLPKALPTRKKVTTPSLNSGGYLNHAVPLFALLSYCHLAIVVAFGSF